ncbi:ATP-binding protein [Burkholderia ambifaria]|uniref:ATP-binding protein n=1 Tax=Burkholderia ambifaria TaxID=152480 RepID=UPI001C93535F|nr:ATP-binding protein [Burkholderia ambifaria]MBY4771899.1 ATP-binding protein [Burkholderia ambifaria]
MNHFDIIRERFQQLDPSASHELNTPPAIGEVYTPADHESALDVDRALVVGDRGMGKTFWASALSDSTARDYLDKVYPRLLLRQCDVVVGFAGVDMAREGAISQEVFNELEARDGYSPDLIWRAVIFRAANKAQQASGVAHQSFSTLLKWAAADAERFQNELRQLDETIAKSGRRLVVLFDALDRLGTDWTVIRRRSTALMRVALAFRSYAAIRLKIFMRTDQASDPSMFAFPDASKLAQGRVNLIWERRDLFGLAFSRLLLESAVRGAFSQVCTDSVGFVLPDETDLPNRIKHDESVQQEIFSAMAGPYMGSDWRKGKTYAWLHNHLADAHGRVSPRSFLVALRAAASQRPEPTQRVFEPKGLQKGVQVASEARVAQLGEEFPWITAALAPLADLRVPATRSVFLERWEDSQTAETIASAASRGGYLAPVEFGEQNSGASSDQLLEALQRIGVAETRPDGRINMPDIFRVASKLLKKGGIRVSANGR